VNNFETGDRLLQEAREYCVDLEAASARRSWNVVVRRAQEVVELALKAALKMMGIEYPKEHDVGRVFGDACRKRTLSIDPAELERVREVSARLAGHRQPAFYMERVFGEEDAGPAREDAQWVLALVEGLADRLRGARP
jgi:HEPN domain-containing protein